MPVKNIVAKTWSITTSADGLKWSAYPAGDAPVSAFETTFNSQYTGWTPITNTTFYTRPAETKPSTKASSLTTASYTDSVFGTKVFSATKVADVSTGLTHLRNDYSKRQIFNADNTKFLVAASDGWWHIYNATTFAWIKKAVGPAGLDCEPNWHPTDPNKLWYTSDFGGISYNEVDVTTDAITTLFSFSGRVSAIGMPTATRFSMGGEGRPSADGRYWCFMVMDTAYTMLGLVNYDRQTDTIIEAVTTSNKPNWTGMSNDGTYAIVQWHNFSALDWATGVARTHTNADGTRAYVRGSNFATWTQLDLDGEHGDVAVDKAGNQCWVSVNFTPRMDVPAAGNVTDGAVYMRAMNTGTAHVFANMSAYSGVDSGVHFSGCAFNRPGWCVLTYEAGGTPTAWKDGVIIIQELTSTSPKSVRVAHHQSTAYTYFASPLATPNKDLTRIMFGSDFRSSTTPFENFMVGLPSNWDTR